MNPENAPPKRYRYSPSEGFERRSQRRLQDDLGVDEAGVEAILHLRRQVIELQAQIRRLEIELAGQYASRQAYLAQYRDIYFEAGWIELEIQE